MAHRQGAASDGPRSGSLPLGLSTHEDSAHRFPQGLNKHLLSIKCRLRQGVVAKGLASSRKDLPVVQLTSACPGVTDWVTVS